MKKRRYSHLLVERYPFLVDTMKREKVEDQAPSLPKAEYMPLGELQSWIADNGLRVLGNFGLLDVNGVAGAVEFFDGMAYVLWNSLRDRSEASMRQVKKEKGSLLEALRKKALQEELKKEDFDPDTLNPCAKHFDNCSGVQQDRDESGNGMREGLEMACDECDGTGLDIAPDDPEDAGEDCYDDCATCDGTGSLVMRRGRWRPKNL